jgi:hypothetical protein
VHLRTLSSPPLSRFSAHLRVLIDPFTAGRPYVGFRLLIGVCSTLEQAFVLRSRSRYSFVPYPSDYTPVRWHFCLSNH